MAIGARWRVPLAGSDCLAMHAYLDITRLFCVACTASFGLTGEIQLRGRRAGGQHLVRIVAILAGGGICLAGFLSQPVNARAVTVCLPLMTGGTIHRLENFVVVRMLLRDIRMATDAGIGPVGRG